MGLTLMIDVLSETRRSQVQLLSKQVHSPQIDDVFEEKAFVLFG
jgi:hypothetical protein